MDAVSYKIIPLTSANAAQIATALIVQCHASEDEAVNAAMRYLVGTFSSCQRNQVLAELEDVEQIPCLTAEDVTLIASNMSLDPAVDPEQVWTYRERIAAVTCPNCGEQDTIAEVDLIIGFAAVIEIREDGSIVYGGGTDMDWNSQGPMHDPAKFVCGNCSATLLFENGKFVVADKPWHAGDSEDEPNNSCPTCGENHGLCPRCGRRPLRCPPEEPGVPFAWCDVCEAEEVASRHGVCLMAEQIVEALGLATPVAHTSQAYDDALRVVTEMLGRFDAQRPRLKPTARPDLYPGDAASVFDVVVGTRVIAHAYAAPRGESRKPVYLVTPDTSSLGMQGCQGNAATVAEYLRGMGVDPTPLTGDMQ